MDLAVAYDTANHRRLLTKILELTEDPQLREFLSICLQTATSLLKFKGSRVACACTPMVCHRRGRECACTPMVCHRGGRECACTPMVCNRRERECTCTPMVCHRGGRECACTPMVCHRRGRECACTSPVQHLHNEQPQDLTIKCGFCMPRTCV